MSQRSAILVATLGLIGVMAVLVGAAQIIAKQFTAAAPAGVAPAPMPAGTASPAAVALTPSPLLMREIIRSIMPAIISLGLMIPSSIVVLSKERPAEHQRWATATISSIVTYWMS